MRRRMVQLEQGNRTSIVDAVEVKEVVVARRTRGCAEESGIVGNLRRFVVVRRDLCGQLASKRDRAAEREIFLALERIAVIGPFACRRAGRDARRKRGLRGVLRGTERAEVHPRRRGGIVRRGRARVADAVEVKDEPALHVVAHVEVLRPLRETRHRAVVAFRPRARAETRLELRGGHALDRDREVRRRTAALNRAEVAEPSEELRAALRDGRERDRRLVVQPERRGVSCRILAHLHKALRRVGGRDVDLRRKNAVLVLVVLHAADTAAVRKRGGDASVRLAVKRAGDDVREARAKGRVVVRHEEMDGRDDVLSINFRRLVNRERIDAGGREARIRARRVRPAFREERRGERRRVRVRSTKRLRHDAAGCLDKTKRRAVRERVLRHDAAAVVHAHAQVQPPLAAVAHRVAEHGAAVDVEVAPCNIAHAEDAGLLRVVEILEVRRVARARIRAVARIDRVRAGGLDVRALAERPGRVLRGVRRRVRRRERAREEAHIVERDVGIVRGGNAGRDKV